MITQNQFIFQNFEFMRVHSAQKKKDFMHVPHFCAVSNSRMILNVNYAAKVPKYRGLAWVICEEDIQLDGDEDALCVTASLGVILPARAIVKMRARNTAKLRPVR